MKKHNSTASQREATRSALNTSRNLWKQLSYPAYIGLDVHKDTISVSVARSGREEPESWGTVANTPLSVNKLVKRLEEEFGDEQLLLCYEAGPCGYVLYRQLSDTGHHCLVVAPSRVPKMPGERVKTDRKDAQKLAAMLRSGNLTSVWVPDEEQEAMRDLVRARSDFKDQERKARQQLNGFLQRHGHVWPSGKSRWTKTHYNWLESISFPRGAQQIVLQEYINAVAAASQRVADMTAQIEAAMEQWSLASVAKALVALRGVDKLAAAILLAELGDISRFDSPRQLASFVGLVPGEHSSGQRRRQRAITKTGNNHARRTLVECAWSYRFKAAQTMHLKRKAKDASPEAKAIAWKAQKRLCGRYYKLTLAGKTTRQTTVAIARELVGFVWDIVRIEMEKLTPKAA